MKNYNCPQIKPIYPSWKRYPLECPTCGKGKESDWEVFSYYPYYELGEVDK